MTADTSEVQPQARLETAAVVVPSDPTELWIAYGVVTDDDRDGVPDWRYGIDNMPTDVAGGYLPIRGWRTNLHTGETEAGPVHK